SGHTTDSELWLLTTRELGAEFHAHNGDKRTAISARATPWQAEEFCFRDHSPADRALSAPAASSNSWACANPVSESAIPASILASSPTRSDCANVVIPLRVTRSPLLPLSTTRCRSAYA